MLTVLMFCIMAVMLLKNGVLYGIYQYNASFFIEVFCENKNEPQRACEGQCQIMKISEEEERQNIAQVFKSAKAEVLYLPSYFISSPKSIKNSIKKSYSLPKNDFFISSLIFNQLDKPPENIVLIKRLLF
ncbi:MAG TPA: hypothetical protein VK027_02410, partial [Chitinophagaceae bacterium]|nr:hypothetical protein [Chitinophagaceae bacterium]